MKNYIMIIIIFTLCFSCTEKHKVEINKNVETFYKFPKEKQVEFKNLFEFKYGEPYKMVLVDSTLIIENSSDKKGYKFYNYNIKSNKLSKGYISIGRGPNEVLSSAGFGIFNNDFWVQDPISHKILKGNKDSLFLGIKFSLYSYKTKTDYETINFIKKDRYIANGNRFFNVKFQEFDTHNEAYVKNYGKFKIFNNKTPIDGIKSAYSAFIFSQPKINKAVMVYRRVDAIEIFNLDTGNSKLVRGPIQNELNLKFQKHGVINIFIKDEDIKNTFVGGANTNKYIYLLFSGRNRNKNERENLNINYSYAKYIFIYDWNGKPIKKIEVDKNIMALAVSPDDKTIYSYDPASGYLIKANINL